MTDKEVKLLIQSAIKSFASGNLSDQSISLFKTLGYNTERQNPFTQKTFVFFKESFLDGDSRFNENKALSKEWKSVDLLFQLTKDEVSDQKSLFAIKKVDNTIIETYLFFALELTKAEYTRTALAQVTREINKVFPMPVLIVFKYGEHLTLSVINRRLNKKDEQKDVLEKVTLIKDISIEKPHRAHIEILFDLSFDELKRVHKVSNFVELHNAWQKTLDSKELNNRFYRELSNWYFWAIKKVSFPNDVDNDKDNTVFNSESIIRLLTRLIFIWFIKEKKMIPEKIFEEKEVSKLIKGFNKEKSTVYYRAILQNLFFATLNQKLEERAFATDGTFEQNKKNYGIKNLYRYASDFAISKAEVIKLFAGVSFLNGGLFDCLDSEDKNGKVMYLDGFSRNPKKQAQIPDELFFSPEKTIDLSDIYADKKKKNETVKGLFKIFNRYKFTITENTPIEEEVALDPELLGRVFENLLASYNPETKTTARKKTGSFYTPREIVNYMVDESLKSYLKQKLETEASMKSEDAEIGLEFLIGYNEKEHLFNDMQTAVLINAIDSCKILDPACGSGAFPMGILHKLVHILHKLDPQNKLWEERQIEKAMAIDDPEIRDGLIADIETAFKNNELDFGRKLYLIENCIYGVDIQPIATQISKLRFFISLIVDQKADKTRDNFGIRPLPNLETKFVAANTLIEITKPKSGDHIGSLFDNNEVKKLEGKLKEVRHRLFSANTPVKKRKLRDEDQKLREEMGKLLEDTGMTNESAQQLAAWDPYNQNTSSPFFDSEWMFGVSKGFDIVIGNPPYVRPRKEDADLIKYYRNNYQVAHNQLDLFHLFIELATRLLSNKGINSFIISNAFLANENTEKLRKFILDNVSLMKIIDIKEQVFEGASVDTIVYLFTKKKVKENRVEYILIKDFGFYTEHIFNQQIFYKNLRYNFTISLNSKIKDAFDLIQKTTERVDSSFHVTTGIKEYQVGKGTPPQKQSHKDNRAFNSNYKIDESYIPEIRGKNLFPFSIKWDGEHIKYGPWLAEPRTINVFKGNKILVRKIPAKNRLVLSVLRDFYIADQSIYVGQFKVKKGFDEYYAVGVLSSILTHWFFKTFNNETDDLFPQIKTKQFKELPLKSDNTFFKSISQLSKYLHFQYSSDLITVLDALVFELYFPGKIKAANAEVLKHLTNLPELKDDWSDEQKMKIIKKVNQELSNPKHPVSIAMEKQKNVPEVRIIEGLDK
ncbi:MAG: N-6 DNA methylase [Chrysiogenia bacterium]